MKSTLISLLFWTYMVIPVCYSILFSDNVFQRSSKSNNGYKSSDSLKKNGKGDSSDSTSFPFYATFSLVRGDVVLYWDVNENETIFFKIRAKVTERMRRRGFIGLGFSPRGRETEADIAMVTWAEDEPVTVLDAVTDGNGILLLDSVCNYRMEKSNVIEENGNILVEVILKRDLDTKDSEDYKIEWGTTRTFVILEHEMLQFHSKLQFEELDFLEKPLSMIKSNKYNFEPNLPRDTKQMEFTVNSVRIPADPTTYWCQTFKTDLQQKVHGIKIVQIPGEMEWGWEEAACKYESLISPGNEKIVHHIELYHCEVPPENPLPRYRGPCPDKPKQLSVCSKVIAAWAMGAEPLVYPENAGVPLGGSRWSQHLMIEVHYNNPQRVSGIIDNSGIRYYYTESLRRYDIGVMEVGVSYSPNLVIPPREEDFEWNGALPPRGIRIFASQLHAHLSGTEIQTKHYRRGEELPLVDTDPHFTTFFQDIRLLPDDVLILPGDTLVTSCRFDTHDRVNVTVGGYGIMDEMCVNYLHYYPKTNLEVCKSTLSQDALNIFFEETLGGRYYGPKRSTEEKFEDVDWSSDTNKNLWRELVEAGPIEEECLTSNGKTLQVKEIQQDEKNGHITRNDNLYFK